MRNKAFYEINPPENIATQPSVVNLMCVTPEHTRDMELRLQEANKTPGILTPDILKVAQMELYFLLSKNCVTFGTDSIFLDRLFLPMGEGGCSPILFMAVQEYFVQIMVIFLKICPHFQSLHSASQAILLRKNMTEVSVLLIAISFERNTQVFRWCLGGNDKNVTIEVDEECLSKYLNGNTGKAVFKTMNSIAMLNIPGRVIILLILICIFSREGTVMPEQAGIDAARNHYRHLLFLYMKATSSESSRLNATLHRVLKTVKDLAETVRSQVIDKK